MEPLRFLKPDNKRISFSPRSISNTNLIPKTLNVLARIPITVVTKEGCSESGKSPANVKENSNESKTLAQPTGIILKGVLQNTCADLNEIKFVAQPVIKKDVCSANVVKDNSNEVKAAIQPTGIILLPVLQNTLAAINNRKNFTGVNPEPVAQNSTPNSLLPVIIPDSVVSKCYPNSEYQDLDQVDPTSKPVLPNTITNCISPVILPGSVVSRYCPSSLPKQMIPQILFVVGSSPEKSEEMLLKIPHQNVLEENALVAKEKLDIYVEEVQILRRRMKLDQQKIRRSQKKIAMLRKKGTHLKNKISDPDEVFDILDKRFFPGVLLEIIVENFFRKNHNENVKKKFSEPVRTFAKTMFKISQRAYRFVYSEFSEVLPRPLTVKKWCKNQKLGQSKLKIELSNIIQASNDANTCNLNQPQNVGGNEGEQ